MHVQHFSTSNPIACTTGVNKRSPLLALPQDFVQTITPKLLCLTQGISLN